MVAARAARKATRMICPKCLTIETEGSLKCRKCGAQLYTGVFQMPAVNPPEEPAGPSQDRPESRTDEVKERSGGWSSTRTNFIAVVVFAVSALALALVLSRLQSTTP